MTKPVQSVVSLKAPIGTTTNLSIPIVVSLLSAEAATAWGSDRVRRFFADSWKEQAEALSILATDPIYLALETMFADHPRQLYKPEYVVVVRRDTPVAQVITVTVGGNADGDYQHQINDSVFTFNAVGQSITQIRDGLLAAIALGSEPVTTGAVGADQYTVTANKAGIPFSTVLTSPSSDLTYATTTPNAGIGEDLADMETEDRSGYMVVETSFDDDVLQLAAKFVQSATRPMRAAVQSQSADIATNVTTDVMSKMKALGYTRTAGVWHNNASQHLAAGWIGRCLAYPVGQINWAHKQITGVTAIDFTEPSLAAAPGYLESKNVNRYDAVGIGSTLYGTYLDGSYIDQGLLKDLLDLGITERLLKFLQTTDIVTFDDDGIALLAGALEVYLKEIADQGALDPASIVITPIPAASVPTADKAVRNYSGLKWSAKARGAINRLITITGIVEV